MPVTLEISCLFSGFYVPKKLYYYRKERSKYHHHREKAWSTPDRFMTLIIDGMDQAIWRLCTHITGVLVHTKSPHGKIAYAFVDLLEYPHDSNLTITIILKVLHNFVGEKKLLPETAKLMVL